MVTEGGAAIHLNKESAKLELGKSMSLKIVGSTKKYKWSSSDISIAKVNKKEK